MNAKKIALLLLIVAGLLITIGITSPALVTNARLGLDLKGGFEILYQAEPIEPGATIDRDTLVKTAESLQKRANETRVAEPEVTPEGKDRIRVKIAGVVDEEKVREILKKPAELTFRGPDGTIEMNGNDFVEGGARIEFDTTNRPIISIKVKDPDKFKDVTQRLLGKKLAIYLDEREITAPVVEAVITNGTAQISGSYTFDEAKDLRDIINLGALPLKLTEKYTQSIGATLGQMSLEKTLIAGIVGFILILSYMAAYYRVPGIIACLTLIVYTWLLLVILNLMNATLTLPGIAAFVLGIGMAVDANVITYERIKEEIRSGKSILSSLKSGSKVSFRAIIDANLTTIIAAAVLFYLGSGAIQGFALILIVSIVVSLITNVFLSRILLQLLVRSNVATKPGYFGVKGSEINAL